MLDVVFSSLVLLLLFILFYILYQVYLFYNPYFPYDERLDNCKWSRWGCCIDKITPKYDQDGTNCRGVYFKSPKNPNREKC